MLSANANANPDEIFSRALDVELQKITSFYQLKELEIFHEVDELLPDAEEYDNDTHGRHPDLAALDGASSSAALEVRPGQKMRNSFAGIVKRRRSSVARSFGTDGVEDSDEEDEGENQPLQKQLRRTRTEPDGVGASGDMTNSTDNLRRNSTAFDYDDQVFSELFSSGISLKKRTISVYVSLCELKSYIQLNQTGFRKVLKKYDKILDRKLKDSYLPNIVKSAYPFRDATMRAVEEHIRRMEEIYANVVTGGDVALAKKDRKSVV